LAFAKGERKKDWFIKFHFIRASHGELPFEQAEIVFGFQKPLQNPCGSRAPPLAGRGNNRPKSEF
jgi:hypothetical protein